MAKSQPMIPANINVKAPKTTLLDGGFFGQRKHRNHGTITEKQIMREENRDANDLCCNCLDDPCCVGIEIDNENEDDCTSVDSASVKEKSSERPASYPTRDISYCGAFTSDARTIIKIFRIDREFRRILSLMLPVRRHVGAFSHIYTFTVRSPTVLLVHGYFNIKQNF